MDTYWWITFRTPVERVELDLDAFFEAGATGTEEVEEGTGERAGLTTLKGFFESEASYLGAKKAFGERMDFTGEIAKVEDWDRSWRDRQTPVEVTGELVVVPPWVDPGAGSKHVIRLEAKMAFGTGSHETTRIAALLLEGLSLQGRSVLDIGAGTGILALYAAQRGAIHVVALDIDPVAGPCLEENLALNPVPKDCRYEIFIGETGTLPKNACYDVIVCNMIRTELWPFRDELLSRLNPQGRFLVSGQRTEDKAHFLAWQKENPFCIVAEETMDGWWGFAGEATV